MTTLPQTTAAIRLPRPNGQQSQLAPAANGGGVPMLAHPGMAHAPGTVNAGLSGSDVWRIIRGHLWLIIITIVVCAGLGVAINYLLARNYPRYTAAGYIEVQPVIKPITDKGATVGDQADPQLVSLEQKTQAALLRSEALLSKVLQNKGSEIRGTKWFDRFKVGDNYDIAGAKEDFIDNYTVTPLPETRLVKVEYTSAAPKDCQTVVREMGEQHIKDEQDRIFLQGQSQSVQLGQLRTKYRMLYQDNEMKLQRLRLKVSNAGGGVMNRVNMKEMELAEQRRNKSKADLEYKGAQAMLDGLNQTLAGGGVPITVQQLVDNNPEVATARATYRQLRQQYEAARDRWGDNYPQVQQFQKQMERAKQEADDLESTKRIQLVDGYRDSLAQNVAAAKKQVDECDANIQQLNTDLGEVADDMVHYFTMEAQQKGVSDMIKQVEDQLDLLESQQQQKLAGKVHWSQLPEVPTNRSFPQLKWSLTIAIALGIFLGLGIAFVRELTDTTIRSTRDIQRVGNLSLLGMVGDETQDPQAAGARLPLVIFDAPHSITAEQLRQVRTRLQHAASLDTTRSLMITSPSPGDGKTTIAVNLAAGLALNGRRILLVDGNFRRPDVHRIFGFGNEQGFSDVLNGAITFDEAVQETQVPNLAVMTSGPKPINATEMFESQLLIDFVERALEEFDHVIFDSGPMMVVSESAAMAPRVDGVVTVVRARSNTRGILTRMRDSLRAVKAEHLGVVLNGVRAQGGGYYGRNIKTYYEYQNG